MCLLSVYVIISCSSDSNSDGMYSNLRRVWRSLRFARFNKSMSCRSVDIPSGSDSFCVMSLSGAEKNHKTIVAESKKEDCSITNGFHNAITLRQTLSVGGIICAHFHSHHNTEREKGERNSNFCFFQFRWGLHFRGGVRLAQIGRTGFCRWLDWMWNKVLVLRIF